MLTDVIYNHATTPREIFQLDIGIVMREDDCGYRFAADELEAVSQR
jgi:hypothetical protein